MNLLDISAVLIQIKGISLAHHVFQEVSFILMNKALRKSGSLLTNIPIEKCLYTSRKVSRVSLWVCSFGVIRIQISDPRSHGSWCIKGTDESSLVTDSSASLMYHDPSDLGSLIQIRITPKETPYMFSTRFALLKKHCAFILTQEIP